MTDSTSKQSSLRDRNKDKIIDQSKTYIERQLYLLGESVEHETRQDRRISNARQAKRRGSTIARNRSRNTSNKNIDVLKITDLFDKEGSFEFNKNLSKRLDKKLVGLSKLVKKKAIRTKAIDMGFNGVWSMRDLVSLKVKRKKPGSRKPFGLYTLLSWMHKLSVIVAKLHSRRVSLSILPLENIFVNRDLEVFIFQANTLRVGADNVTLELDLFLLGKLYLEMICVYYNVSFDYEETALLKTERLERAYLSGTNIDANLQQLLFFVGKEVKNLLNLVGKNRGEKLPVALIDLIVQNCSPAGYNRRKASEMGALFDMILEDQTRDTEEDDLMQCLELLLTSKKLNAKLKILSKDKFLKAQQANLDSLLPLFGASGIFDADVIIKYSFKDSVKNLDDAASEATKMPEEVFTIEEAEEPGSLTRLKVLKEYHEHSSKDINTETVSEHPGGNEGKNRVSRARSVDASLDKLVRAKTVHTNEIVATPSSVKNFDINPEVIASYFDIQKQIPIERAIEVVQLASKAFADEPNILSLRAPVCVVGDLHGQYFDLRRIMQEIGNPNPETDNKSYLFLGDYVDRGPFSCEIFLLLCSLKVKFPGKIWMIRGNHESRVVSSHFGFKQECFTKYGARLYNVCVLAFQALPIGATVSTKLGKWLCVHGGISDQIADLHQFVEVDRFAEPALKGLLCDVLWADPVADEVMKKTTQAVFKGIEYTPNHVRGCSCRYGFKALKKFLSHNRIIGIIRAHEVQQEGYKLHFKNMHAKSYNIPIVLTVFSSPNYCGSYGNKGATLIINNNFKGGETVGSNVYKNLRKSTFNKKNKNTGRSVFSTLKGNRTKKRKGKPRLVPERDPMLPQLTLKPTLPMVFPLDLVNVVQFEPMDTPEPLIVESVYIKEQLNIQNVCPYMPLDAVVFVQKVRDLYDDDEAARIELEQAELNQNQSQDVPAEVFEEYDDSNEDEDGEKLFLSDDDLSDDDTADNSDAAKVKFNRKMRFKRAVSVDSFNEMNPISIRRKLESAERSLSGAWTEISKSIRLSHNGKKEDTIKSKDTNSSSLKITPKFTKNEVLALKALFTSIETRDEGNIAAIDILSWAQDYNLFVLETDASLAIKLIGGSATVETIDFQTFLGFAAKCKQHWISYNIYGANTKTA